jgi:protein-S-isoprenylcysteine O-methyltransferase Ste14
VLFRSWYGSLLLTAYVLILLVAFHLRVVLYEEPWLRRHFGSEWESYSSTVSRWLPLLRKKSAS